MKKLLFIILVQLIALSVFAQTTQQHNNLSLVKEPDISNLPDVTFTLNYYYPHKIKQNQIKVEEDGQSRDFKLTVNSAVDRNANKTVLILFEKMHNEYSQIQFYNNLISNTIDSWMHSGDKVNIAYFDRSLNGSDFLTYALTDYTTDVQQIKDAIEQNNFVPNNWNTQQSSELYSSILQGLKDINQKKNVPQYKMIVVLTAGYNLPASNSPDWQTLVDYSIQNKIPIYIIQYFLWENRSQKFLAENSYGRFVITSDINEASDSLTDFMQNSLETIRGYNYKITYQSKYKKDNKQHVLSATIKNEKINLTVKFKCDSLKCFILNNIILVIAAVVILVLIIFFIFKKKKTEVIDKQEEILPEKKEPIIEDSPSPIKTSLEKGIVAPKQAVLPKADNIEIYKTARGQYPRIFIGQAYFEINKNIYTVGRAEQNDLTISESFVSREHFRIYYKDNEFWIEDLGSTNGTFLNNKRIKPNVPLKLKDNDIISILQDLKIIFKQ